MPSSSSESKKIAAGAARLFFVVAMVSGLVLLSTHIFDRIELQTINARFELRRWMVWTPSSLAKLNIQQLWRYHEQHEIPRQWWAWDYTLSWLLADNHPVSQHKFVLFNHQLEDEPPMEALESFPWMKPLEKYPLSRATVGDILLFLAKSGARLIIIDNDFPQFSPDDAQLARAITACRNGTAARGRPVPILMARTINHHSSNNILQLEIPTAPSGLLHELSKLLTGVDPLEELTGSTGVTMDEDQVVRRLASRLSTMSGHVIDSIALKALKATGEQLPTNVPAFMDIDFAGPPNSEIYPIRPISYLLDPAKQKEMSHNDKKGDVKLDGAIVILGDSVVDVFNTPTTNFGVNQMSGAEILANSIDTLSRKSWFYRFDFWQQVAYLTAVVLSGSLILYFWKTIPHEIASRSRLFSEISSFLLVLVGSYIMALILFAHFSVIVPVVVPAIALTLAALISVQWEREQEKTAALKRDLKAAEDKLSLQAALHKSELNGQQALADAREAALDRERRKEFARRINHDLRAPVSVLSWTIAKLRGKKLTEEEKLEKIDRLSKTADRMFGLINELVSTYNNVEEEARKSDSSVQPECNVKEVLTDSVKMQQVLAEEHSGTITLNLSQASDSCFIEANALQLSRVVDNIIRNAFLHNKAGINVEVALSSTARNAVIRIVDNGKGIAPEHLEKIFTPGYRVDKKIDRDAADGQGLGLDIVNSFVENMKGSVGVESTVGEGTTFIINLPVLVHEALSSSSSDSAAQSKAVDNDSQHDYLNKSDSITANLASTVEQTKA